MRDLDRMEALRLSVALALVGRPRLLGVDDTDLKLSDAERAEMWTLLRSLTESGITVVAVCGEAPEGAVVVSTGPDGGARAREGVREASEPDSETATDTGADTGTGAGTSARTGAGAGTGEDGNNNDDTHDNTDNTDKETADALAETRRA